MIPALFVYLFKANLALAIFCAIHYAVLHRLTFVKGNRWFLLGGALCAMLLPLVPVNDLLMRHEELQHVVVLYLPSLPTASPAPTGHLAWDIITALFWIGVTVMAIRFMLQLLSLGRLHRSAQPEQIAGYRVHTLHQSVSPFSFFRNIYLNPALHAPQTLPGILRHEAVHVRQWHTLDVMLGAAVQIFAWFNPAAWLLQHAIRENLEFITDRTLLREGMDAQQYQYSLLQVNGIPTATAIANNFNFSSLKNRIKMMNKQRSPQYQVLRYAIPVVAAGALVLVLNASKAALMPVKEKIIHIAAPLITPAAVDTALPKAKVIKSGPSKDKGEPAIVKDSVVLHKEYRLGVDTTGQATTVKGNVIIIKDTNGNAATVSGKGSGDEVVVTGYASPRVQIRDTASGGTKVIHVLGAGVKKEDLPLYILDGKPMDPKDMETLDPSGINSIDVLKGDAATAIYGPKGKNGVILISLKKAGQQ